jgi:hypothetical protein
VTTPATRPAQRPLCFCKHRRMFHAEFRGPNLCLPRPGGHGASGRARPPRNATEEGTEPPCTHPNCGAGLWAAVLGTRSRLHSCAGMAQARRRTATHTRLAVCARVRVLCVCRRAASASHAGFVVFKSERVQGHVHHRYIRCRGPRGSTAGEPWRRGDHPKYLYSIYTQWRRLSCRSAQAAFLVLLCSGYSGRTTTCDWCGANAGAAPTADSASCRWRCFDGPGHQTRAPCRGRGGRRAVAHPPARQGVVPRRRPKAANRRPMRQQNVRRRRRATRAWRRPARR